MPEPIIRVENLSKAYRIGSKEVIPTGALGTLKQMVKSPFQYLASTLREPAPEEMIWALKDVSFEVYPGEVVGIIGRNGAGKSTLLKILSRITKPTSGFAEIRGRVASLLEVGTGFHPELTGRENVYLNGTILGMTKREVDARFDEIVEFSGVEKFIDTPVKRYSSGMQVRLAFAVAAHLDPEILIIDEVLAVGDFEFQRKCLNKINEFSSNKTVLLVSHQMTSIQQLCSRSIMLQLGSIAYVGETDTAISKYLAEGEFLSRLKMGERKDRKGSLKIKFIDYYFMDAFGTRIKSICCGQDLNLRLIIEKRSKKETFNLMLAIGLNNKQGVRICLLNTLFKNQNLCIDSNSQWIDLIIKKLPLSPGDYSFNIYSTINGEINDWIANAGSFKVEEGDFYGTGKSPSLGESIFLVDYNFCIT